MLDLLINKRVDEMNVLHEIPSVRSENDANQQGHFYSIMETN